MQTGFGFVDKMAMVLPLNQPFERKRDQQADRDREQMQEEVARAVWRFMGSMDVEQREPPAG
jgi:hypothetical protein